jgi:hypothetical protein
MFRLGSTAQQLLIYGYVTRPGATPAFRLVSLASLARPSFVTVSAFPLIVFQGRIEIASTVHPAQPGLALQPRVYLQVCMPVVCRHLPYHTSGPLTDRLPLKTAGF